MSELKARMLGETMNEYGCDTKIYLKSETDKEIAELKKACNDKDEWCLYTLKENRHQKYKRCLAMARICLELSPRTASLKYDKKSDLFINFYDWWYKHWMELAEKFKEA